MGKHSRTEPVDDLFEDNHPSCMWGILHALDYHHWQYNVRKMLPHKKHYRSRHAKVGNGRQKVRLNVPDSDEDQELLGAEMDPSTTETSATNKRSLKARIKALISQEPSDTPPRGKSNGWSHRFIFLYRHAVSDHMKWSKKTVTCNEKFNVGGAENVFEYLEHKRPSENHTLCPEKCVKAKENLVNQKHVEGKEHCVDASCQCKEYADVLEIFNLNKDTGDGLVNCFHNLQASNARTRLIKSGSFPAADFLHSRKFRPSKLKHKQNEVWSCPKGEKLFAPKLSNDMSELLMVNDTGGEVLNQDLYFSSMDSTQGSDKQENSKVIIDRVEDDNSSIFHEIDGSAYNLNKVKPIRVRRTSSLSGSLERYAQLLQNSSSREAKLQASKSLKLSNEYEIPSGGHAPTSFKRFQSLPHLGSYGSLQNELSCDAHVSRIETWTVVDSCKNFESESHDEPKPVNIPVSTEKYVPLEANRETEFVCNIVERSDSSLKNEHVASVTESTNENSISEMLGLGEEMEEQTVKDSYLEKEKEVTLREIASNRLPQPRPVSVLPSCSQEDVIGPNDFPASQDLDCRFSDVDETESSVDFQYRSSSNALTWSCSIANPESFRIANKSAKNHRQDNADFDYVSDILERSGFNRTGFLGPWHSLDQPLNPLVFEEAEACWSHEPQRYGDEHFASCHQLLFDLINEVMVQIYDTSFTYYPKALSVNCRIPPIPLKYNVVDDAWERISRTLSSRQGLDQSMDCVGVQDLGKDDGWMNLQLETECVGLELEDIIFDELLEEILRS